MVRKQQPQIEGEPELRLPHDEAAQKLDDRIGKGTALLQRSVSNAEDLGALEKDYKRWDIYNVDMLAQMFNVKKVSSEYGSWAGDSIVRAREPSSAQQLADIKKHITTKIERLQSIKERLELFPLASGVRTVALRQVADRGHTNRAFVVHGHDTAAREAVARFLERQGIEAIILDEQATSGRTLVEKLEHYSDVDFAVVLLTPDDVGGSKNEPNKLQPRARQNVLLELGYFIGLRGRGHVCALFKGPLELPTDIGGVGYVPLDDAGAWKFILGRELRAAGFDVDLNKA